MLRSSNPVMHNFNQSERSLESYKEVINTDMTVNGTLAKTGFLLLLALLTHSFGWNYAISNPQKAQYVMWTGLIGGFIIAMVISIKPMLAPWLSSLYAVIKGAFLGVISYHFESRYPGVVSLAVGLTLAILVGMVLLYHFKWVRVQGQFRKMVMIATFGVMIFYIVSIIAAYFFNFHFSINSIQNPTLLGIGFSLFVVALAAFNLVIDFQFIEGGEARGLPKFMEWYGAFGLLVTIVWLYIEILKLAAKLRNR